MSTRGLPAPAIVADDPGPWSVVTHIARSRTGRPGKRYAEPPRGLMLAQPPYLRVALHGLDESLPAVGAGRVRAVAAAREPVLRIEFDGEDVLRGVSPYVLRSWSVPDLMQTAEERPGDDPAAGLAPLPPLATMDADSEPAAVSPDGSVGAVPVVEASGTVGLGLLRASDGAALRWIRGARTAAWSPGGGRLAIGGEWGVLLLVSAESAAA